MSHDRIIEDQGFIAMIPKEFVGIDFQMNPETDDLRRGSDLRDGDIVLVEDLSYRYYQEGTDSPYDIVRNNRDCRWALVTLFHCDSQDREIISFIGVYADGTKSSRIYAKSICWFVKK